MKNFKVVLLLTGLSTGLIASGNNGSEAFGSKFSAHVTSLYTQALTAGNDYVAQPLSQATASVLTVGNDYVVKPVSDITSKAITAISNSSVAQSASNAATIVSTKASEFGTSSVKFYENNETAVNITAVVVTVATIAAIIKYQQDGYLFYAPKTAEVTSIIAEEETRTVEEASTIVKEATIEEVTVEVLAAEEETLTNAEEVSTTVKETPTVEEAIVEILAIVEVLVAEEASTTAEEISAVDGAIIQVSTEEETSVE